MNNNMIAFCGLICTDCPAYLATQADDDSARKKVAEQWREAYQSPVLQLNRLIAMVA